MKKISFILALVLLMASPVFAITFLVTGTEVSFEFTEPSTNANAAPLLDLAHTNIYFQVGSSVPVKGPNLPALALAGGGIKAGTVTVPVLEGQEADVTFWATATDLAGNESAPSLKTIKRIDRLAPAAPK